MAKTICIIPARGGSKRLPRKNILPLNGIPLLAYTIRAAKAAKVFDKIVVSSEDKAIQNLALQEGVSIDNRPENMAGDKVTMVQVTKEYLNRIGINEYEQVAVLLPTCPFRTAEDVQKANQLFNTNASINFLVGVVAYDFPIQLALELEPENIVKMVDKKGYQTTRSQDISVKYHPNGSIYLAKTSAFLENGSFFAERMLAYEMPAIRSFDIDYPYQLEIAEVIAKKLANCENDLT